MSLCSETGASASSGSEALAGGLFGLAARCLRESLKAWQWLGMNFTSDNVQATANTVFIACNDRGIVLPPIPYPDREQMEALVRIGDAIVPEQRAKLEKKVEEGITWVEAQAIIDYYEQKHGAGWYSKRQSNSRKEVFMSTTQLAAITKPSLNSPAWRNTVRRLDEAFERRWSFRVVSYQVRRREVLVLGELSAAGQVRQQFGSAKIGSLNFGKSARTASLNALVRCAGLFGIEARERQQEAPPPPSPLRQRLGQVRDAVERLPGGEQAFREVLRQFEVRRPEQVLEEALPDAIARCEQVYRVPLPSSTNGRSVHA